MLQVDIGPDVTEAASIGRKLVLSDLARHTRGASAAIRSPGDRVGVGGMGVVYLAHDRRGHALAVKVLRAELAESPGFRARFRREIVAAGNWSRPAPLDSSRAIPTPTRPTSSPSTCLVRRSRPTSPRTTRSRRGSPRVHGRGAADSPRSDAAGLVHRDLKPTNVLLTRVGPKIIDFGVAQGDDTLTLTETGQRIGTRRWMAPEQASGAPITPATDVFAWGALVRVRRDGYAAVRERRRRRRALSRRPRGPRPHRARPVVDTDRRQAWLAKHPDERPSGEELLDELLAEPSSRPGGSPGDGRVSGSETKAGTRQDVAALLERAWPHDIVVDTASSPRRRRRGRALVAAAVIVALAVVATAGWQRWTNRGSRGVPSPRDGRPGSCAPARPPHRSRPRPPPRRQRFRPRHHQLPHPPLGKGSSPRSSTAAGRPSSN